MRWNSSHSTDEAQIHTAHEWVLPVVSINVRLRELQERNEIPLLRDFAVITVNIPSDKTYALHCLCLNNQWWHR